MDGLRRKVPRGGGSDREGHALDHLTCKGRLRRLRVYFLLHHKNESQAARERLCPSLQAADMTNP